MKVVVLNGSPRKDSDTEIAIREMQKIFEEENIECEVVKVGNETIKGCIACGYCYKNGKCITNDIVNDIADKFEKADGLIVASPVYYASANATLVALLQRLFHSTRFDKTMKVGASIVCCRRGGASATFDELNKFFTISGMPLVSSQYWNSIHGMNPLEAEKDDEGKQVMRTLARNMSFLIKSISLGKVKYGLPKSENKIMTNFIK